MSRIYLKASREGDKGSNFYQQLWMDDQWNSTVSHILEAYTTAVLLFYIFLLVAFTLKLFYRSKTKEQKYSTAYKPRLVLYNNYKTCMNF